MTTSKASVLKMLEVDGDFAKKVAVPAVSSLQELGTVLSESGFFNSAEIRGSLEYIQRRTGSDQLGIGIKTVLDCVFEARAGGTDIMETFSDLLVEKIQDLGE